MSLQDSTVKQLQCVSYAPFRRQEHTPFHPNGRVDVAQIEEDLKLIKPLSNCVRTYGVGNGLASVPMVAETLGMKVHLGAWISADKAMNRAELDQALALSQKHPNTVQSLIVGNEVLLRKELPPKELIALLKHAKSRTNTPITYADVWEFWLQNAELSAQVDFVTVHILPYWEDEPVAATNAVAHLDAVLSRVRAAFVGKPIWVGETGWPAAGRQREAARPGLVEQTQVIRQTLSYAEANKVSVNIIEAFDQHWKRALEGGMGSHWGMLRADGSLRASLTGPVSEDASWWRGVMGAIGGAAMGLLWTLAKKRTHAATASLRWDLILSVALLGCLTPLMWDYLCLWNRSPRDWAASGLSTLVLCTTAVALVTEPSDWWSMRLHVATLFIAACWALILLADPRYRGFPTPMFIAPAIISLVQLPKHSRTEMFAQAKCLATILLVSSLVIGWQEGWKNYQAWGLLACWISLAVATLRLKTDKESAASTLAGAANSAL